MEQVIVEEVRRLQAELDAARQKLSGTRDKLGTLIAVLQAPRGREVLADVIADAREALAA